MKKILFLMVCCLFAASCGEANNPGNSTEKTENNKELKNESEGINIIEAPDFTFEDTAGKEHTLSDYKGKIVLLNFWVIYCPSCRAEIASLMKLREKYKNEDFVILGVSLDKNKKQVKTFTETNEINYTILLGDMKAAAKYGIRAVPTTFIMNLEGKLSDTIIGYNKRLEQKIEKRLLELSANK